MKSILISIRPEYVEKILNGDKTIEIRKTMPKCELPCKVYIYCTKGKQKLLEILHKGETKWFGKDENDKYEENIFIKEKFSFDDVNKDKWLGKVVAEFELKEIEEIKENQIYNAEAVKENACLSIQELSDYSKGKQFYCWHIDNLVVYDKPKELSEFKVKKEVSFKSGSIHFNAEKSYRIEPLKRPPQSYMFIEGE